MKILIASDKYKESCYASEVGLAIAKGIQSADATIMTTVHPMADGGDGSLGILEKHLELKKIDLVSEDPLGRSIRAYYLSDGDTAYIELAVASGMELLDTTERAVMKGNTFGSGLLIKHAIEKGNKNVNLFLGGSCTNDAGLGILCALGYKFLDGDKNELRPCGKNLDDIDYIISPEYTVEIDLRILTDVSNTLHGRQGAAYVYGPQKKASSAEVELLDKGLQHIAVTIERTTGKKVSDLSGTGAAGGIAAGLVGFLGGKIENGFKFLSTITDLEKTIQEHDIVITGEGRIDRQSYYGKVVGGIVQLCAKHNKKVILVAGEIQKKSQASFQTIILDTFDIIEIAKDKDDAMKDTEHYLEEIGKNIVACI
jgi:glycerate kinase